MTQHKPIAENRPSLLERAAEIYDFGSGLRVAPPIDLPPAPPKVEQPRVEAPRVEAEAPRVEPAPAPAPEPAPARADPVAKPLVLAPAPRPRVQHGPVHHIDREALRRGGYILPDAPVTGLAEEFRLVKRQLLRAVDSGASPSVLIASGQPDEGKTFCALNLALSLASERDVEVLLVDADFNKPEIMKLLGVEAGPGFVDAIEDEGLDVEALVVPTDLGALRLLAAGRQANNVPELLASDRTQVLLDRLTGAPRRIVIFDSPPVLAASPAAILAAHVGQVILVVRADRTTEADLREAAGLLSACDELSLLLNGAGFAASGRRYGTYNGYGQ